VAGIASLGLALSSSENLRELQLHGNQIFDDGAAQLFRGLEEANAITTLNLSQCRLKSCLWSIHIRNISSLCTLLLAYNQIDESGLETLFESLEASCCLRHLDLSHNLFGTMQSLNMPRFIRANGGILSLNVSGNPLCQVFQNVFAEAVAESTSLLTVDITLCGISAEQSKNLQEVMTKKRMIQVCNALLIE